ncbi:MAG: hypothetical protein ABI323_13730 [Solirubrobacteraceae bacterium]
MRTRPRATSTDLRRAVECLPRRTRVAMLEGIAANPIIAGAYANQDGVCPMLAAHRAGGRTSLIAFARTWDRFAFRDARKGRARRATERELGVLKAHLETSLLEDDAPAASHTGLAAVRHDHLELQRRRRTAEAQQASATRRAQSEAERLARHRPSRPRPGDPDRSQELGGRSGWSWTRLFRRYDDYELALPRLQDERREAESGTNPREPERDSALTR